MLKSQKMRKKEVICAKSRGASGDSATYGASGDGASGDSVTCGASGNGASGNGAMCGASGDGTTCGASGDGASGDSASGDGSARSAGRPAARYDVVSAIDASLPRIYLRRGGVLRVDA